MMTSTLQNDARGVVEAMQSLGAFAADNLLLQAVGDDLYTSEADYFDFVHGAQSNLRKRVAAELAASRAFRRPTIEGLVLVADHAFLDRLAELAWRVGKAGTA